MPADPFIGQLMVFGGNFAPRGWALCNGQLLQIAQNTALFSLLSTTYGGDGRTTFAIPNLQGIAPMHPGRGPGLTSRRLGERGGQERVTLTEQQLRSHSHGMGAAAGRAEDTDPGGKVPAAMANDASFASAGAGLVDMASQSLTNTGGGQSHNNMQPYLALYYVIALVGIYPSRS